MCTVDSLHFTVYTAILPFCNKFSQKRNRINRFLKYCKFFAHRILHAYSLLIHLAAFFEEVFRSSFFLQELPIIFTKDREKNYQRREKNEIRLNYWERFITEISTDQNAAENEAMRL